MCLQPRFAYLRFLMWLYSERLFTIFQVFTLQISFCGAVIFVKHPPATTSVVCWSHYRNAYFRCLRNNHHIERHRSSRLEVFCKRGVLRNITKFTGKHLCRSLFFPSLRPATLLKKGTLAQVFSCEFC